LINEITVLNTVKNSLTIQLDKSKEANYILSEVNEIFKHLSTDFTNKTDSLKAFDNKILHDLSTFESEKQTLEKQLLESQKTLEDTKSTYTSAEKEKSLLIDKVKTDFENITKEQIQVLKMTKQESEVNLYNTSLS
jgi:hypothetical protein